MRVCMIGLFFMFILRILKKGDAFEKSIDDYRWIANG